MTDFNSIKVRLEQQLFERLETAQELFQFHKGAIRTMSRASIDELVNNFNSIKVRLELTLPATVKG